MRTYIKMSELEAVFHDLMTRFGGNRSEGWKITYTQLPARIVDKGETIKPYEHYAICIRDQKEIWINPHTLGRSIDELKQTLIHEFAHFYTAEHMNGWGWGHSYHFNIILNLLLARYGYDFDLRFYNISDARRIRERYYFDPYLLERYLGWAGKKIQSADDIDRCMKKLIDRFYVGTGKRVYVARSVEMINALKKRQWFINRCKYYLGDVLKICFILLAIYLFNEHVMEYLVAKIRGGHL